MHNIKLTLQTGSGKPFSKPRIQAITLRGLRIVLSVIFPVIFGPIGFGFVGVLFIRSGMLRAIIAPIASSLFQLTNFLTTGFLTKL